MVPALSSVLVVSQALRATEPVDLDLRLGEARSDQIVAADGVVTTPDLEVISYPGYAVRGRSYRLEVEATTDACVRLESWSFDPYLVLRDATGAVVAENDNGPFKRHAQIEVTLETGVPYRVEACALHGDVGPFIVLAERAPCPVQSFEQKLAAVQVARDEALASGDDRGFAWTLMSEVHLHYDQGRFDAGAPLVDELLELRAEIYGPDHPLTIGLVDELAIARIVRGEARGVIPILEEQLERRREVLGPDHIDVASSHVLLASAHNDLARFDRVIDHRTAAIEILRPHAALRPRALVSALASVAHVEVEIRSLSDALEHLDEAREVAEMWLPADDPYRINIWGTLGFLAQQQGRHEEAVSAYERAIELSVESYGEDHPFTARLIASRAMHLLDLGDFARARRDLERALESTVAAYGPGDVRTASVRADLGHAYFRVRNLERAEEETALESTRGKWGEDHPLVAIYRSDLAAVLRLRGDLESAIELQQLACDADRRVLGPSHPRTLRRRSELAKMLARSGREDDAMAMLDEVLEALDDTRGSPVGAADRAMLMEDAAILRVLDGDIESAVAYYTASLELHESLVGPASPETTGTVSRIARHRIDLGEAEEAWRLLLRGSAERLDELERALVAQTEAERFRYLAGLRSRMELIAAMAPMQGDEGRALAFAEFLRWRGILGRVQASSAAREAARLSPDAHATVDELRSLQGQLSQAIHGRGDDPITDEELDVLRRRRADLERKLATLGRDPAERERTDLERLSSSLPDRTALLVFVEHRVWRLVETGGSWSEPRVSAWHMRNGGSVAVVDLGPAAEIGSAVTAHLASVVGATGAERGLGLGIGAGRPARTAGARLRELVWEPLAGSFEGIDRILVSPDGALTTLPLETIPLEGGRFLIEEKAFVYSTEIERLVGQSHRPAGGARTLLAVGAVDFDRREDGVASTASSLRSAGLSTSSAMSWSPLPGTGDEVRAIAALHAELVAADGESGSRRILVGAEATEEELKDQLSRHAIVHLATHGFFQRDDRANLWVAYRDADSATATEQVTGTHPGLLSGLACAGANASSPGGIDDGCLTAEEVAWLDLGGTDLVVLSACETALGRAESGEGMIGLRRAFTIAGARSVVSSLWSVDDDATRELMVAFYRRMWEDGLGVGDALRAAQLERLHADRAAGGDGGAVAWGAFVLSGKWR